MLLWDAFFFTQAIQYKYIHVYIYMLRFHLLVSDFIIFIIIPSFVFFLM